MGDSKVNLQKEYGPNCIGNVIRILDKNTLIINSGTDAEMELGDIIQVYELAKNSRIWTDLYLQISNMLKENWKLFVLNHLFLFVEVIKQ